MSHPHATERKPLPVLADIQVMRGIAVLLVIIFHLDHDWLPHGFIGVDIFFAISGCIISLGLLRADQDGVGFKPLDFLVRRVKRLLPALLLTVGSVLVLGFLLYPQDALVELSWSAAYTLAGLSNLWFFTATDYFSAPLSTMPLLHTWSLGVEEQFYVTYAILLAVGTRWLTVRKTLALIFIPLTIASYALHKIELAPVVLLEPIASLGLENVKESLRFFAMPFRIAEFGVGVLAALLVTSRWVGTPRSRLLWRGVWGLGVLLLIALAMDAFAFDEHSTKVTMGSALIAALVLFSGIRGELGRVAFGMKRVPVRILWSAFVWLGDRSYSLYLVHWPLIVFYSFVSFRQSTGVDYLVIVLLMLVLGAFSYRFAELRGKRTRIVLRVENPGIDHGREIGAHHVIVPIYLLLFCLLIVDGNGFKWRIPPPAIPAELDPTTIEGFANRRNLYATEPNGSWSRIVTKVNMVENEPDLRVLVIGDSHAGHLNSVGAYLSAYGNVEWTQYTFTGCTPLFGYTKVYGSGVGGAKQEACTRQVSLWQEFILAHSGVFDFVILANRWNMLFNPGEIEGLSIREDRLARFPYDGRFPSIEESRQNFVPALRATARMIEEAGATTIVFGQAPTKNRSAAGCDQLPRYLISQESIHRRCSSVHDSTMVPRSSFVDQSIAQVADTDPLIHGVVLTEIFCPGSVCTSVVGDRSLYRDDNHLNGIGAMYLLRGWMKDPKFPFSEQLAGRERLVDIVDDQ